MSGFLTSYISRHLDLRPIAGVYVEAQGMVTAQKSDLPQGTLDLLILNVVALGPMHGYAIAQRLRQVSRDVVQCDAGDALSGAASS